MAHLRVPSLIVLAALQSGCGADPEPTCNAGEELARGEVSASLSTQGLDGAADGTWTASAGTFTLQASEVFINVNREDGWGMVIHALRDVNGDPVVDLVAAGTFPIEVALHERDETGGEAFLYAASGEGLYTGEGGTGSLTLTGPGDGDDTLAGCFAFTAAVVGDAATSATLTDGALHLREL